MYIYIQYSGDELPTVEQVECELIKEALHKYNNVHEASEAIGVSNRTIYRRLDKMGLDPRDIKRGIK